jgi:hypothetical protein
MEAGETAAGRTALVVAAAPVMTMAIALAVTVLVGLRWRT